MNMEEEQIQNKLNQIQCPKHAKPLIAIDFSKVCQDNLRTLCEDCEFPQGYVTKSDFIQLFKDLLNLKDSKINKIQQQITQNFDNILNLIQTLNSQLIKKFLEFKIDTKIYQEIEKVFSKKSDDFTLKDFENLASMVVLQKERIQKNDQNLAQSDQCLDMTNNLQNYIENIFVQLSLSDQQIGRIENSKYVNQNENQKIQNELEFIQSDKIDPKVNQTIMSLQMNFDETILAVRYVETQNNIQFLKFDESTKNWIFFSNLECYTGSLISSQLSKLENSVLTVGYDKDIIHKNQSYSIKLWKFNYINKNELNFLKQKIIYQAYNVRISFVTFSYLETQILAGEGTKLIIFRSNFNGNYIKDYQKPFSSETICTISSSQNLNVFSVGCYDSVVYVLSYIEERLNIIQKIKLMGIPKTIIFGSNNLELFILIKDGILFINRKDEPNGQYMEIQRIVNHIDKIRAIQLNEQIQFLAIGGETNNIQVWKRNDNMQWKCQNQHQQDNFIESICFNNKNHQIISSNNHQIFVHKYEL